MTKKQTVKGVCRICGQNKILTEEHVIPRKAGGGTRIKLYSGNELLKALGSQKPYGEIKQNGHAEYTLCAGCNNLSGHIYDEDFANFFNIFAIQVPPNITIPKNTDPEEYLENKKLDIMLMGVKPFNVAKRILVSFCSVDYPGLTDRKPEIRRAILDKDYHPKTNSFSLYLGLHVGNISFFATQAVMLHPFSAPVFEAFAGIETDILAFYFSGHNEHLKGGHLTKCVDITTWLRKYSYNEIVNLRLELMFNRSLTLRFPVPS